MGLTQRDERHVRDSTAEERRIGCCLEFVKRLMTGARCKRRLHPIPIWTLRNES